MGMCNILQMFVKQDTVPVADIWELSDVQEYDSICRVINWQIMNFICWCAFGFSVYLIPLLSEPKKKKKYFRRTMMDVQIS